MLLQIASADLIPVRERGELCHVGQVSRVLQRVVVECRQALADFGGSRQYPGVNGGPRNTVQLAVVKVTEQYGQKPWICVPETTPRSPESLPVL